MARIKYGSIITSASGSVGGSTFQKSRMASILRSKPNPIRSVSASQSVRRSFMAHLLKAWSDLTPEAREKWTQFVAYSNQTIKRDRNILISGYNLFLKYQYCRLLNSLDLLIDFTYIPIPDWTSIDEIFIVGSRLYVRFRVDVQAMDYFFILKISSARSLSAVANASKTRYMKAAIIPGQFFDITDSYISNFGVLPTPGSVVDYSIYFFSIRAPLISGFSINRRVITSVVDPSWMVTDILGFSDFKRLAFGNDYFYLLSNNAGNPFILRSANTLHWDDYEADSNDPMTLIQLTDTFFTVPLGFGSSITAFAFNDPSTQIPLTSAAEHFWADSANDGVMSLFVSTDGDVTYMATSFSGTDFTIFSPGTFGGFMGVAYGAGLWVAVGNYSLFTKIILSTDGETWIDSDTALLVGLSCVAYGAGLFVAFEDVLHSDVFYTSNDGNIWHSHNTGYNGKVHRVKFLSGNFYAVGAFDDSNIILFSNNGLSWSPQPVSIGNTLVDIASSGTYLVAISDETNSILVKSL